MQQMSLEQWESLCDGCARCCLHKIVRGNCLAYTSVHCTHLDTETCRCTRYRQRRLGCVVLTPEWVIANPKLMPNTCAYRLVASGEDLPEWHPLVSGDADSVDRANMSVRGRTISEDVVGSHELDEHAIRWVEA